MDRSSHIAGRMNMIDLIMASRTVLAAGLLTSALLLGGGSPSADQSTGTTGVGSGAQPNIVVVMADDMGYSDIGSYGASIIETPTLDRLAGNGLRFTQFYSTARCVPTRASLLTGLYPHQAGLGHMTFEQDLPGYRGDLNEHNVTIAEVLGEAGYSTYMSGKWHVTPFRPEDPTKHNWPLQRGFDRFFGTIIGAGSYYDPASLVLGNEYISPGEAGESYTDDDFYYTDAISDYAARYIRTHAETASSDPFFLYVSYTAPHWPLHAPKEAIEKYEGVRPGLGPAATGPVRADDRNGPDRRGVAPDRAGPKGTGLGRGGEQGLAGPPDGGLRRPDRPDGPGHRTNRGRPRADRPVGEHPDPVLERQRRSAGSLRLGRLARLSRK